MMYQAIEDRYQFALPPPYRTLHQNGCFDLHNLDRRDPLHSTYLWLFDVEWWSLDQILTYTAPAYHLPGFVPFASTDAGDFWCWWPARTTAHGTPVVLCPHDQHDGHLDAPDFAGWLYRRVLTYALWLPAPEQEGRAWLERWIQTLSCVWAPAWQTTIRDLVHGSLIRWEDAHTKEAGQGVLTPTAYATLLQRDLATPGLDETFRWMR
jgi:hypothetical protein